MSARLLSADRLSAAEREHLAELEGIVERGLATFIEVGVALAAIRDRRLYRETHASFEAYCRARWGRGRRWAYQLIDAAEVCATAHAAGLAAPANEAQARALAPLLGDEAELLATLRELRAEYGERVNAALIKRLVRRRLQRVERERASSERVTAVLPVCDKIDVRHGHFRQALADLDAAVDAVIADPPYSAAWIARDGADFAEAAARMLKPTGTLVLMFGQLLQYELKPLLDTQLRHRWTCCYLLPGPHGKHWPARISFAWKPVLVYTRHDAPKPEFLTSDVFASDAPDKAHHDWGQSESGLARLVDAFSQPGDLVVDPFLGGGTTAVACLELGRRFIGCDIDQNCVAITRQRLAGNRP